MKPCEIWGVTYFTNSSVLHLIICNKEGQVLVKAIDTHPFIVTFTTTWATLINTTRHYLQIGNCGENIKETMDQ